MSGKRKRRQGPYYGRIILTFALLGAVIYFLVKQIFYTGAETALVAVGTLDLKSDYTALVLRNEMIVETATSGGVTYFVSDGQTVNREDRIAEIYYNASDAPVATASAQEIERQRTEVDYNAIAYDVEGLKRALTAKLSDGAYEAIPDLKRELSLKLDRLHKLQDAHRFLSNRPSAYADQTIGEHALEAGQKMAIYAPVSGILTYTVDGYESQLNIENVYRIDYETVRALDMHPISLTRQTVQSGDALFKIVDNSAYYVAVFVENEEIETYKNSQSLSVTIEGAPIEGDVYDVFMGENKGIVIIRLRTAFPGFYNTRKIQCTVMRGNYKGLKIHVDSIVNREGTLGVYMVDDKRTLRFVPVKPLGYDEEFAIVYNGQFYDQQAGVVRSIQLNWEILRHAKDYEEGQHIH